MVEETSLWWENITGPSMLIDRIEDLLADGKSVILQLDTTLPWPEQMRDFVMHRPGTEALQLRLLEWEPMGDRWDIVPYLLGQYYRQHLKLCPPDYDAQLKYLKEEHVLGNCAVWIPAGDNGGDLTQAVRFVSDYRSGSAETDGVFVLEVPAGQPLPQLSGRVEVVRCSDSLRFGNVRLFASMLADAAWDIPPELKSYAACVSANLAGMDAELIPMMLQRIDFAAEDPGAAVLRLQEECSLPYSNVWEEKWLEQTVWRSQLQTVFAGIEMERLRLAGEHGDKIEEALSTEYWNPARGMTGYIDQHGDELNTASDVELGTLRRMMSLRRNSDRQQFLLYFPEEGLRDWISFLTDCRNTLAHHRVCSPEQMYRLLTELKSK